MSFLFLVGFLGVLTGDVSVDLYDAETCIIWALFAIADALWFKGR